MPTIESILNEICTEASEGPSLGCLDRCTTTELIEAQKEFPHLQKRPKHVEFDPEEEGE